MKTLVLVVLAIAALAKAELTEEQKQKLKESHQVCLAESAVDAELITKARQGDFTDDDKLKKYAFCMSRRIGFQNDAGEIQVDVIKQKASSVVKDPAVLDKLVQDCAVKRSSPEETAFETFKCYYTNTPNHVSVF